MAISQTRRNFVRTAPLAAAALLPAATTLARASTALGDEGQAAPAARATFQVYPKATLDGMLAGLQATPGAKDILGGPGLAISMTVSAEEKKIAKEFEYHEHRDHVFQVLDGTTVYQLGGTPKNARMTKPGEWLAPESEGFTTVMLSKGDMLSVPRMTPHKRLTEGKVSLLLINATTPA